MPCFPALDIQEKIYTFVLICHFCYCYIWQMNHKTCFNLPVIDEL